MALSPTAPLAVSGFSDSQISSFVISTRISSGLSIFGSLAVIISLVINRSKLQYATYNRLILNLSITDFIFACATAISRDGFEAYGQGSLLCMTQGFIIMYMLIAAVMWTGSLAMNLLLTVVFQKSREDLRSYEKYYFIAGWGVTFLWSGIFILPPLHFRGAAFYGPADFYCWIGPAYKDFRIYIYYVPLWIMFFFIIFAYTWVGRVWYLTAKTMIKNSEAAELSRMHKHYVIRTSFYVIVFVISWVPPTINRIRGSLNGYSPSYELYVLHSITVPLTGFLNAVVFFWPILCGSRGSGESQSKDIQKHPGGINPTILDSSFQISQQEEEDTHFSFSDSEASSKFSPNELHGNTRLTAHKEKARYYGDDGLNSINGSPAEGHYHRRASVESNLEAGLQTVEHTIKSEKQGSKKKVSMAVI